MAIRTATIINKEKNSVTTTISIEDILSKIADTMSIVVSCVWDIFNNEIANLEFPRCKVIEFPEICYQRIKDKIPNVKSSGKQKILKDITKIVIIKELLICMGSHQYVQSYFLINSKNNADFIQQIRFLEKEIKYLLDIYTEPFLSIKNRYIKGTITLNRKKFNACMDFLSVIEKISKYDFSILNIHSFCSFIVRPLFNLAKKDLKTYENYLTSDYIRGLIKNNPALDRFLDGLYRMEIEELGSYSEYVKVVMIMVFLATYKENTNFKNDELRKFLLKLIGGTFNNISKQLQNLMALYGI